MYKKIYEINLKPVKLVNIFTEWVGRIELLFKIWKLRLIVVFKNILTILNLTIDNIMALYIIASSLI